MAFFEAASHYRINGGNFSNSAGNTSEYRYDSSVEVDGQGNAVTYAPQSYRTGSSIINNSSGQMTIIGQGDNAHIQLGGFDFQGNSGMYRMPAYPQMHVSMPPQNPGHTAFGYSPQDPRYFDPHMGHPQQFVPEQTMYQSNVPYVNQFPMADVPSATAYTTGPTNVGIRNESSWAEPPGTARSSIAVEHPGESGSFYTQTTPPQPPPMMPVPSLACASVPLQIPSQVPAPVPLPMPASVRMPIPSEIVGGSLNPISPVTSPSTPSWSPPQERATTPPTSRLSIRATESEVHRSPSSRSQDATQPNFTTPYAYRAVDQTHAHEAPRTVHLQDEVSTPYSAVSSTPVEARRSERVSSPSPSHRSPPPQRPASTSPRAPETIQTPQPDSILALSSQITSPPVASGSTSVAVQSLKTQEDRVSARPSEKVITGAHEVELSLDSIPPPAYSLEPETPFQAEEIRQEPTSVVNLPPSAGVDNQENRYSYSRTEVVRLEEDDSLPDIILPKKKKKKQSWRFSEMFTRRSKKNNDPAIEL